MSASRRVVLACPVAGCGAPLERGPRAFACPRGHAFDVARSGYCNLLQPRDKRSADPGDSKEAARARRRLVDAGLEAPVVEALLELVGGLDLPPSPAVLDVGCGEGSTLAAVAGRLGGEGHGVDLSRWAVDLAARRYPELTWLVANADRVLPYAPGAFDLVLSISSRRASGELRRLLQPRGWLVVAVPGSDDLIELREAVLGEGVARDRRERAAAALAADFELVSERRVRSRARLEPATLRDLLAATYRGARASRAARIESLVAMDVTTSRDLLCFAPRPSR